MISQSAPTHGNHLLVMSQSSMRVDHAEVLLQETASHDSAMKYLADSRTWLTVSVEKRMGGGRGAGQSVRKREVVGRVGEQRKKGRRGEGGNERGKKR